MQVAQQTQVQGDDDRLVELVLAGDVDAWQRLVVRINHLASSLAAKRFPTRGEDFVRGVALRAIERVEMGAFKTLARFAEVRSRYPALALDAWIHTVIKNAAIDELRAQPDVARSASASGRKLIRRPHVSLEDEHGSKTGAKAFERSLDARRVLRWIRDGRLTDVQRQALSLWLFGHGHAEIAAIMSLSTEDVSRLLRSARQRLRRKFEVKS